MPGLRSFRATASGPGHYGPRTDKHPKPCPRCGAPRIVRAGRGELCRDCRSVEPHWPHVDVPVTTAEIRDWLERLEDADASTREDTTVLADAPTNADDEMDGEAA